MKLDEIEDEISIVTYDNFYLIHHNYGVYPAYYLGYLEKNKIKFTTKLNILTDPIDFKEILNDDNYNGIEKYRKRKKNSQGEKDLIFLDELIKGKTDEKDKSEDILFELLTPLGDILQDLRNDNNQQKEFYLNEITNDTVIDKIKEISDEIKAEKNSELYLANGGKRGEIYQITNSHFQNLKDGLYYVKTKYDRETKVEEKDYNLIGNILIHKLTLTYDKLKLFNPVTSIKYTNTTTNQVVTIEKEPYEAIANNIVNNRLIDSNSMGVESLLNKIWVQGVNNIDFITADTDLLKDGFFVDMETGKVLSNNVFEKLETSDDDVRNAIKLFNEIIHDRRTAIPHDCTLFRFMLWSPFAYCLKQLGFTDGLYSMVLWGVSDTNKTGSSVMFSNLYTNKETTLQKANTQSAIGTRLGENTFPLILDEAKDNLLNPNDEEFNKNIVTDEMGRAVKDRANNNLMIEFPALRLTVRTLNQKIEYKKEFLKRHKVLYYDESMRVKEHEKLEFNKRFKPNAPNTPLKQSPAPVVSTAFTFKVGIIISSFLFLRYAPFSPKVTKTFCAPLSIKHLAANLISSIVS